MSWITYFVVEVGSESCKLLTDIIALGLAVLSGS